MKKNAARVVALMQYLGRNSIHEGWHSTDYPRLVAAVKQELTEKGFDYHVGMDVDWYYQRAGHLVVGIRGVATGDQKYLDTWPLSSRVGDELLEDLKVLASNKAMQDIEKERLAALRMQADGRVADLMLAADRQEESAPADAQDS